MTVQGSVYCREINKHQDHDKWVLSWFCHYFLMILFLGIPLIRKWKEEGEWISQVHHPGAGGEWGIWHDCGHASCDASTTHCSVWVHRGTLISLYSSFQLHTEADCGSIGCSSMWVPAILWETWIQVPVHEWVWSAPAAEGLGREKHWTRDVSLSPWLSTFQVENK